MPRRRKGERATGPYPRGDGWRVLIRGLPDGGIGSQSFATQGQAQKFIDDYNANVDEAATTLAEAFDGYEKHMIAKGNKARSYTETLRRDREGVRVRLSRLRRRRYTVPGVPGGRPVRGHHPRPEGEAVRKRRQRLNSGGLAMLERAGWLRHRRFRRLLSDAELVRNFIHGDSPAGHPRNLSLVPGWAVRMCERFPAELHHNDRVAALMEMARALVPLEVRIVQENLGDALTAGHDPREIIAMLRGESRGVCE